MHILIAPNAFKNSLDAEQAAEAILQGLRLSGLTFTYECFPVGDGGNGTAALIIKNRRGQLVSAEVHDPLGRKIRSHFGFIDEGRTAVIEMADAAGLHFLNAEELNPLHATSFGCGEMIRQAMDLGVRSVLIGMGGSATVDGGTGILRALGIRFLNSAGEEIPDRPETLIDLERIDLSGMDERLLQTEITVLCDVGNLLLGKHGAATVFGPQKGASADGVEKLEMALRQFQKITLKQTGRNMALLPSGGTAGGAAAGLWALANARLVNGIDYFLDLTGYDEALKKSNLVITGEGSIDEQTLHGKAPFGVAQGAKKNGLPVIALAGKIPLIPIPELIACFDILLAIGNGPADLNLSIRNTGENLARTACAIGKLLAIGHLED